VTQSAGTATATYPTGTQFAIDGGGYHAVVTEVGAGLRSFEADPGTGPFGAAPGPSPSGRYPLVWSYAAEDPVHAAAGQLLTPWPNRVADGRYTFDGQAHRQHPARPGSWTCPSPPEPTPSTVSPGGCPGGRSSTPATR
jgi:aldose 1-epimerase